MCDAIPRPGRYSLTVTWSEGGKAEVVDDDDDDDKMDVEGEEEEEEEEDEEELLHDLSRPHSRATCCNPEMP